MVFGSIYSLLPPPAAMRPKHLHERVAGKFLIRNSALKQPNDLRETGVEIKFFGIAKCLGPAGQQELRYRVIRQAGDVFSRGWHRSSPLSRILPENPREDEFGYEAWGGGGD
jgi:hypothetical protein